MQQTGFSLATELIFISELKAQGRDTFLRRLQASD